MKADITVQVNSGTIAYKRGEPLRDTKAAVAAADAQWQLALHELHRQEPDFNTRYTEDGVQPSVSIKVRYDRDTGTAKFAVVAARPAAFRAALEQAYLNLSGDAEKARAALASSLPLFFVSHHNEIL